MKKILVLASGNGTNFQAIIDAIDNNVIEDAKITKLICNNKRANVMQIARDNGILPVLIDTKNNDYNKTIYEIISGDNPDLIVLDGYMKILPDFIINKFLYKIINIHPSLLPAFGGKGYYGKRCTKRL
ncbi:phosphoribosylglycinamide formyltransferase [Ferroplasma acidiphilum]|jgi:phosphoribosylglycinamide formyltransferase-1|uniref:phosphoribosylglycinamide formyltransferase n=1 Tax=Ferroplasma acidiphilum TaxID=74969 RepID=UPI00202A8655|nr:formyltransferase family protein [Ferroplasma acidiphilum]WMT53928.1 MAG: formyltransferase family protein [Ferroplasma acidiphilum]